MNEPFVWVRRPEPLDDSDLYVGTAVVLGELRVIVTGVEVEDVWLANAEHAADMARDLRDDPSDRPLWMFDDDLPRRVADDLADALERCANGEEA